MATRDEPVHRGAEKGRAAWTRFRYEIREARLSLGKSQATAAREAGIDQAVWSRLENDRRRAADLETLGRMAGAVGLDLGITLYPAPRVLRDHGSILLREDTKRLFGPMWDWRHEVRVAGAPDLRAWDLAGVHRETRFPVRTECELAFRDCQATMRRIELKSTADGNPRIVLSIRASRGNRHAVELAMPMLRTAFPLSAREALPALQWRGHGCERAAARRLATTRFVRDAPAQMTQRHGATVEGRLRGPAMTEPHRSTRAAVTRCHRGMA